MPTTISGTIYDSVTLIYLNLMKWVWIYFVYKGGKSNRSGRWGSWQRADGESFCYGGEGAPVSNPFPTKVMLCLPVLFQSENGKKRIFLLIFSVKLNGSNLSQRRWEVYHFVKTFVVVIILMTVIFFPLAGYMHTKLKNRVTWMKISVLE